MAMLEDSVQIHGCLPVCFAEAPYAMSMQPGRISAEKCRLAKRMDFFPSKHFLPPPGGSRKPKGKSDHYCEQLTCWPLARHARFFQMFC